MPNYKNGKIYKIVCDETGLTYIGSTTQTLKKRLQQHEYGYNLYKSKPNISITTSFKVLEGSAYRIELLEDVPFTTKSELYEREGYFVRSVKCVNKHIPNRSYRQYCEDYRDKITEIKRRYKQKHGDKIRERDRRRRETDKDAIREKKKQEYIQNATHIKERSRRNYHKKKEYLKEKITCDCGCVVSREGMTKHKKTKKHSDLMNVQQTKT